MTQLAAGTTRMLPVAPPPRLGPPAHELSERSRQVLDGLEALVVAEGFAAFTLADLARRLRCSLRVFYEIAPNRHELLRVAVDRRMRRLGRLVRQEIADLQDPLDKLHTLLTLEVSTLQGTSEQFRLDAQAVPSIAELIADHKRYGAAMIHDILVEGMAQGRFRTVDPLAVMEFIDAAVSRLEEPRFADHGTKRWSGYVHELSRFVEASVVLHD